jgi:MinD superfamily P-loop ATPase
MKIAIVSGKDGRGKTNVAANLARVLMEWRAMFSDLWRRILEDLNQALNAV